MHAHPLLLLSFVFLASTVTAVPLFKRLGMGSVLGYLAAGSLLGPWALGVVTDVKSIMSFAEFGVVLLLFIIGLELQPSRIWAMRKAIFGLGTAQLVVTTFLLTLAALAFGLPLPASLIAGIGLSLSSTAFAVQILSEKKQLNTAYGRTSFAVLLFQDLAVIPLLGLVPLMSHDGPVRTQGELILSSIKVVGVIAGVVVGGRLFLRPFLRAVSKAASKEVFTAAALCLVIGTALIMDLAGLSMALGTFLAGMLLADSEFRHELEADIDPFKGLLLGLFFMAVGMSVDYGLVVSRPLVVISLAVGFMLAKAIVVYLIGRAAKFTRESARNMAVVLSQGGEFAFVLLAAATAAGVMTDPDKNLLTVVVTVSMALSPLFFYLNDRFLCPGFNGPPRPYDTLPPDEDNPVIVAGFGRVGQIPARVLRVLNIGLTALEHSSEQVDAVRRFGQEIYYGDASRLDLLEAAGAKQAKAFVLAIDDPEDSLRTARVVREHFPNLRIFARARNRQHAYELMNLGITDIFRETFASSLELTESLLKALGLDETRARDTITRFRNHDEKTLMEQRKYYGDEASLINYSKQATQQLVELFRSDKK